MNTDPGRLNSCLSRGAKASTNTIETSSSAFVYLERNPSPISNPVSGQYQEKLRTLFHRQPEREHRRQPEKDRQRINCHQERTDIEDRGNIERDDRPQR